MCLRGLLLRYLLLHALLLECLGLLLEGHLLLLSLPLSLVLRWQWLLLSFDKFLHTLQYHLRRWQLFQLVIVGNLPQVLQA